jgi:long-chain acyl-CoA synthetase
MNEHFSSPSVDGGAAYAPVTRPRLLFDLLDGAVAEHPDWPAIDFLGRRWTYRDLGRLVRLAARGLQDIGVTPGARVGLCLPNTPYFPIFYFAALRIGAIVVNFNPLYAERELEHQIKDSGTTVMVVADLRVIYEKVATAAGRTSLQQIIVCPMADILPLAKSVAYRVLKGKMRAHPPKDARHVSYARLIQRDADPDAVRLTPEDIAVLQYTGGTTGLPKGAMLTHASLVANCQQIIGHVGHLPDHQERTLGVLPLFHVFALTTVLNYSVATAAEMVLLPRFEMKPFLKTIKRTQPTQFFAVPTLFAAINALPQDQLPDLSAMRFCVSGGAPLPLDMRQRFEARTGMRILEGYGLTEASPVVTCNPVDGQVKDNSAGLPLPGTVLEIRSLDDPHRLMPRGERGEVSVRGPQVMKGYWQRPAETEQAFIDGALRTGDVGYLDADGYLFLVDRIKDIILCSGYNVYPRAIEDALYDHPAVVEAVVIGVPDSYRGQAPKAFVVLHAGAEATPESLSLFLEERISKIEMPREIEIRDSLPKTLIGKLSKKELVQEEAALVGR